MYTRCRNPKFKDYHLYGGRGITVCIRWLSFENFFNDVGICPGKGYSLDRFPNGDGNYEPGNVRWATAVQQARNWKHRNVLYTYAGDSLTLSEWAERLRMTRESLRDRIESGWPIDKVLSTPPIRVRRRDEVGRFA